MWLDVVLASAYFRYKLRGFGEECKGSGLACEIDPSTELHPRSLLFLAQVVVFRFQHLVHGVSKHSEAVRTPNSRHRLH